MKPEGNPTDPRIYFHFVTKSTSLETKISGVTVPPGTNRGRFKQFFCEVRGNRKYYWAQWKDQADAPDFYTRQRLGLKVNGLFFKKRFGFWESFSKNSSHFFLFVRHVCQFWAFLGKYPNNKIDMTTAKKVDAIYCQKNFKKVVVFDASNLIGKREFFQIRSMKISNSKSIQFHSCDVKYSKCFFSSNYRLAILTFCEDYKVKLAIFFNISQKQVLIIFFQFWSWSHKTHFEPIWKKLLLFFGSKFR